MTSAEQNTTTLRDIHLPDAISWWPPAIGWWILLLLIIAALILLPKLYRKLTFKSFNQVAKSEFQDIISRYNEHKNPSTFVVETSKFLRQIAMTYRGREKVAQLTGENWILVLNQMAEQDHFVSDIKVNLINAPYQKDTDIVPEKLINIVQNWLADLPKQPKRLNK